MRDLFLNCGSYLLFEKANLPNEQRDGQNRSQPIGHRACMPQAFERIVENVRQNEYGRNQENQLTRERKKNTFASIADKKDRHDTIELGWNLLNKEFPDWHKNPYLKTMKGMKNKYFSMVYSWNIYFFAWLFRNFKKDNV